MMEEAHHPAEGLRPSTRVLIIADDFTGAGDTGILFRRQNAPVSITLDADKLDTVRPDDVVRVVLTDTRLFPSARAAEITGEVLRKCMKRVRFAHIYQKIDSTMRGSVGAEVEASLEALGMTSAVVCPAFPEMGRSVSHGRLLIDGCPVSQTQYGRDPRKPIVHDAVADIIHDTNPRLETVSTTPAGLAQVIEHGAEDERVHRAIVVDAGSDDDLRRIADVLADHPEVLPVGAAGLGRELARVWLGPRDLQAPTDTGGAEPSRGGSEVGVRAPGLLVVASGSANPRSIAQLGDLARDEPRLPMVRIDKQRLLNRYDGEEEIKRVRGEIERILGGSNEIGIALSDERVAGRPYRDEFETFVAESVAFAIGAAKAAPQDVAIVIAGADTSHSCCRVLGINELLPKYGSCDSSVGG